MNIQDLFELAKSLRKDTTTTGLSTQSNLNFYYLEPTAKNLYPVFYPLLASIPRVEPSYNGVRVGGPAVNWKAIVGIGNGGYPMISEGNRNAQMTFTERDYSAAYKYIGEDGEVTFQAQQTGMGFEDNVALCQVSLLNQLLNDEEKMLLYGNSGSGGNGFQLGTAGTVTITGPTSGGSVPNTDTIYVCCIALTGWGIQLASATGVKLPFVRTSANGALDTINGGTSAYSAIAGPSSAAGASTGTFAASVAAIKGAMGYAWFVGTTNAYSGLKFYSITPGPSVSITALPSGGNQAANASTAAGNFSTDNSANTLDFDGLSTWGFGQGGYWQDYNNANLTAVGDGTIAEFETVLDNLWTNYKISPDRIWLGGTLIDSVSKKILAAGNANTASRLNFTTDDAGRLVGGTFSVAYRSKYGAQAGNMKTLDVLTHPWLPQGVVLFDLINNPYPAAANAIPAVRRVVTLEDHFSIKWPYTALQHQLGAYAFETFQHYIPFGIAQLTGVGNS